MSKKDELSPAKLLANLANAQLSTGPRTEPGKAKTRMNALRHGLTGQFCVMNEPDRLAYHAFEKDLMDSLAPVGALERQLAITITQNHWRLNRARAIETNAYGICHHELAHEIKADTAETEAAVTQAKTWLNHHDALANMTLYETRIINMLARLEKRLEQLQEKRLAAEKLALADAELLLCRESALGLTPDLPKTLEVGGFVFSTPTVFAKLNREAALQEARFLSSVDWNTSERWSTGPVWPFPSPNSMPKAA